MVLWVFGYGSLIWNPGFDFDEKILGFIRDTSERLILLALTIEAHHSIRPGPAPLNPKMKPYAGELLIVSKVV
jgi:hypothetical protein